jgi:hypothetical protein
MLLRQGAWINAHTGKWAFIPEHADWAKREGNLVRIGLPVSIWETIRNIPNDYGRENRKNILLAVMAAGGIRMVVTVMWSYSSSPVTRKSRFPLAAMCFDRLPENSHGANLTT